MQYKLKNNAGAFFVSGSGFTGNESSATVFAQSDACSTQECLTRLGFGASQLVEVPQTSFGVVYIRKGDVNGVALNKRAPEGRLGQRDPSRRRFATEAEAVIHGSRFNVRKANRGDAPGSAGHRGFFVVETNDPVNARINPKTGLTNRV